ncbi:Protein kinase domain-containing protein [Fusarium sp. LHS14.1]|nr:Protein kinase domain-containing protein [Fusarium sp. LHS14.1]
MHSEQLPPKFPKDAMDWQKSNAGEFVQKFNTDTRKRQHPSQLPFDPLPDDSQLSNKRRITFSEKSGGSSHVYDYGRSAERDTCLRPPRLSLNGSNDSFFLEVGAGISITLDTESSLADRLCDAMEPHFKKKTKSWLSREALLRLCQPSDVLKELKAIFHPSDAQRYCNYVCGDRSADAQNRRSAHKIFAILVLIKELDKLGRFVNSEICDDDLPFIWEGDILCAQGQPLIPKQRDEHENCFKKGEISFMQNFHDKQWQIHVPLIYKPKDNQVLEYQLHSETIMPWTSRQPVKKQGGFAKVYRVEIHPDRHAFDEYDTFALKVLHPPDQEPSQESDQELDHESDHERFQAELYALRRTPPGPHVIELLATFKRGNELSFLFPWANDGNLADLMGKPPSKWLPPTQNTSQDLIRWLAEQCTGLAQGLCRMHTVEPKFRPGHGSNEELRKNHGIHGDLKPENILRFPGECLGKLKLSDFGLTKFHTKESRSNQPGGGGMSLTYASPEQRTWDLSFVSRKSDVWALGCVFSMLLTWAIRGPTGLQAYNDARHNEKEPGRGDHWHEDTFCGLNEAVNGKHLLPDGFYLKKAVHKCIETNKSAIQGRDRESNFLTEFLDFIHDRMLRINLAERATSEEVHRFLDQKMQECRTSDSSFTLPTLSRF